jgi:hypothetical protein
MDVDVGVPFLIQGNCLYLLTLAVFQVINQRDLFFVNCSNLTVAGTGLSRSLTWRQRVLGLHKSLFILVWVTIHAVEKMRSPGLVFLHGGY